jgi:hypothetical protein
MKQQIKSEQKEEEINIHEKEKDKKNYGFN